MATKIILKKSNVLGSVPLAGDLDLGELALNLADRKLYSKNNSGEVVRLDSAYVGSSAPGVPAEGDLWYDTTNDLLKTFNGSTWLAAGYTALTQFGVTATAAELNILDGATLSTTELNYVDGVTSSIQTQLDGKAPTSHTHTASSITDFTEAAQDAVGGAMVGTGIVTVTYNDVLNTIYVGATEVDTLSSVTGRGNSTSSAIIITNTTASTSTASGALTVAGGVGIGGALNVGGDVVIGGNLTVNGTTTVVNSNEVNIGDSIILLNSDEGSTPTQDAGFEVERGTLTNVRFVWNETNDAWDMGNNPLQNVTIDGGSY
jgi:hypothetical protein